jgi:hypothetical protein
MSGGYGSLTAPTLATGSYIEKSQQNILEEVESGDHRVRSAAKTALGHQ